MVQVPVTCLTCGFEAGRGSRTLCLNSVRDGFGNCLDARSTLILTERDAVVLDQIARVNRLVGLNPSSSAPGLFFVLEPYGDRSRVDVC